ncbi:MAG: DNA topoisomerase IB [Gemmatimonadaceae bacterium]
MSAQWITRHGGKRAGFRYENSKGRVITDAKQLERINALVLPPAWRDVHIAATTRTAIQAWGFDVKGRKQYRYHERAVAAREQRKYYRVRRLARDLPRIRESLYAEIAHGNVLTRDRVAAAVVRLISKGFFRVGSERYARENHTFGISSLLKRHVHVDGSAIVFDFKGKSNKQQKHVVVDHALAKIMRAMLKSPGTRLFRYTDGKKWKNLSERDVNGYVRGVSAVHYTAKDFRTWGGTVRVATVLSDLGPPANDREAKKNVVLAIRLVSAELGNTPAICRASYVHPIIIARYLDHGETIMPRAAGKTAAGHYPEERALIRFLDEHFPERRKRVRAEDKVAA